MKASSMKTNNPRSGAVSLFIVIFTMLLVTIITMSFIRIMLSDQRQATASDLSQSAYDSAQAGVEDAKRALLYYQSECAKGEVECDAAFAIIGSPDCNVALSRVVDTSGDEVLVQQNSGDNALQQAYTCVKIATKTDDYLGALLGDVSKVVPLVGTGSFDTVRLEWFSTKDLQDVSSTAIDLPAVDAHPPLLTQASWSAVPNRPSLVRAQLMQFSDAGFNLNNFDDSVAGTSNANTLFLYPSSKTAATVSTRFVDNARKAPSEPTQVHCTATISSGEYACSADLILPAPINGGAGRTAFLRLAGLYKNTTNYRLTLLNGGVPVQFDGVQPTIDSTGRANDLFRRVQSRVEMTTSFPYPNAAVDTDGNLCKNFLVTDSITDYVNTCP